MKPLSFVGGISKRPKSEPPVVIVRLFGTRGSIVAARRGPRFTEMRDDCPDPVSYTHLTLPTIYSV